MDDKQVLELSIAETFALDPASPEFKLALGRNAHYVTLRRLAGSAWAQVGTVETWERQLAALPGTPA